MKTFVASLVPTIIERLGRACKRTDSRIVATDWPRAWRSVTAPSRFYGGYYALWDNVFADLFGKVGATRRVCILRSHR